MIYTVVFARNNAIHSNLVEASSQTDALVFFQRTCKKDDHVYLSRRTTPYDIKEGTPVWNIHGKVHGLSATEVLMLQQKLESQSIQSLRFA